jgi:hypothetical protein
MEGQGISRNVVRKDENIEFIDFERAVWPDNMKVWLDRRYRVMPLDGYDSRYRKIDGFRDNINVKDPVFDRR